MSRRRSTTPRGASPARAGGRPGVFVQQPRSDVYVAMLGIALAAMILGCLLLLLILNRYEFSFKAASNASAPASTALAANLENPENRVSVRL
jgi:hypothetical protein